MIRMKEDIVSTDILLKNQIIIEAIRKDSEEFLQENGRRRHYHIVTYGCQMNEHDSEKISAMLTQMGYIVAECLEDADFILFNTCCVRENAELKVFGNLGALKPLKEAKPDLVIAVSGCMMQQIHIVEQIKAKYKHVDLVFGTHNLHDFPKLLQKTFASDDMLVDIWHSETAIIEGLPVIRKKQLKAFVNIMYGCNNYCTYCIVPYTRGRERSRKPNDIIKEVQTLINEGVKEITLLGQNVNSYGLDFDTPHYFADLLRQIDQIKGKFRIRFMTPHPKDFSDALIKAIAELDSVCEHIHLPVQAGSDALLKVMNRKYDRKMYLSLVEKIKSAIPEVNLSTDIIIGFPGESEDDVTELIELIKIVKYDSAFTFIYSKREGTPASKMANQIDEDIKHRRFEAMLEVLNGIIIDKNKIHVGRTYEVLVEGKSRNGTYLMGRTRTNRIVNFAGEDDLLNRFVNVNITKARKFSLYGELSRKGEKNEL